VRQQAIKADLDTVREKLGKPGAAKNVAQIIQRLAY